MEHHKNMDHKIGIAQSTGHLERMPFQYPVQEVCSSCGNGIEEIGQAHTLQCSSKSVMKGSKHESGRLVQSPEGIVEGNEHLKHQGQAHHHERFVLLTQINTIRVHGPTTEKGEQEAHCIDTGRLFVPSGSEKCFL